MNSTLNFYISKWIRFSNGWLPQVNDEAILTGYFFAIMIYEK